MRWVNPRKSVHNVGSCIMCGKTVHSMSESGVGPPEIAKPMAFGSSVKNRGKRRAMLCHLPSAGPSIRPVSSVNLICATTVCTCRQAYQAISPHLWHKQKWRPLRDSSEAPPTRLFLAFCCFKGSIRCVKVGDRMDSCSSSSEPVCPKQRSLRESSAAKLLSSLPPSSLSHCSGSRIEPLLLKN
jgi:hypothetical protein